MKKNNKKEIVLTGLKPTGELHAITVMQDKDELKRRIRQFLAMYIACRSR